MQYKNSVLPYLMPIMAECINRWNIEKMPGITIDIMILKSDNIRNYGGKITIEIDVKWYDFDMILKSSKNRCILPSQYRKIEMLKKSDFFGYAEILWRYAIKNWFYYQFEILFLDFYRITPGKKQNTPGIFTFCTIPARAGET